MINTMTTFLHVTEAELLDGYQVRVVFNNGDAGVIDLEPHLWGPVFEPLRDPQEFCKFSIIGHTIAWPNDADFAPEFLHSLLPDVSEE
jgi:hypothetical protein